MAAFLRNPVIAAALLACISLPYTGRENPPQSDSLVLWFDASDTEDLVTGSGDTVLRWDNRTGSPHPLAFFSGTGTTPPVRLPAAEAFGSSTVENPGTAVVSFPDPLWNGNPGLWRFLYSPRPEKEFQLQPKPNDKTN